MVVTFRTDALYDARLFRASHIHDTRVMDFFPSRMVAVPDPRMMDFFPWRMVGVPQLSAVGMCSSIDYWTEWVYNWMWDPRVVQELVWRRYNLITNVDTRFKQFLKMQEFMLDFKLKSEGVQASQTVDNVSVITCMVCTNEMLDNDIRTKICGTSNCSALVCGSCTSKLEKCPTCRITYGKPPFVRMSDPELQQYKSILIESSKMYSPKPAVEPTIVQNCQVEFNAFVPSELPNHILKDYSYEIQTLFELLSKYIEVNDLFGRTIIENNDRYRELQHTFSQLHHPGSTYEEASFCQRTTGLARSEIIGGVNHHDKIDTLRKYFLNEHSKRYRILTDLWSIKHRIASKLDRIRLLRLIDRRIPSTATFCRFFEEIVDGVRIAEAVKEYYETRKRERELNRLSSDLKLIEPVNKRVCIQRGEGEGCCRQT